MGSKGVFQPNPERTCPTCGREFALKRFFGQSGKRIGQSMGFRPQTHCSRHCAYEGQRKLAWGTDKNGYSYLTSKGHYIYAHRIAMERAIGRQLRDHETVHHKNGIRSDNRIENLELWSSKQPKGQRISDKLKFARDLLQEYGAAPPMCTSSAFVNGLLSI